MIKGLRQEVEIKKTMHPFDAKERPSLYKMNFLNTKKLIANFSIILDPAQREKEDEAIPFPSEDKVVSFLTQDHSQDLSTSTINISIPNFTPEQPLAVICNKNNGER